VSEAAEAPPAPSIANKTILLLDDDVKARESVRVILDAAGLKVVDASFRDDIRELFDNSDATVALICVADTEDRELALCIKIKAMSQGSPLSIIMCAPNWTRTGILKALKYGAKDILLQPCDAGELVTKVSRFLKAA
jgi:DNA-binding response OmpR family regulator